MAPKLGIVAGGGALPGYIVAACRETGRDFFVLGIEGGADTALMDGVPGEWIRLQALGKGLDVARREGVGELVLVGKIPRPSIGQLMRDLRTAKFLAKVGTRILGDNNVLAAVARELEEVEGFRVVGPDDVLSDLLARSGPYGRIAPDGEAERDIVRGMEVVRQIGRLDIGQAVVVQNGRVLGVEAAEGTDALIARCAGYVLADDPGGVLVKMAKPGQERRIDLPAVGVGTVEAVAGAGLSGIAVEAGGALVIDSAATAAAADSAGIFVTGVTTTDHG